MPATLGLLRLKVFWNKDYGVIISIHEVTNDILSRDSNYIVDVAMWPKFGNSRSYHNLNFVSIWPKNLLFLRGGLGSSSIIWDLHQVWPWNFAPMCQKS